MYKVGDLVILGANVGEVCVDAGEIGKKGQVVAVKDSEDTPTFYVKMEDSMIWYLHEEHLIPVLDPGLPYELVVNGVKYRRVEEETE